MIASKILALWIALTLLSSVAAKPTPKLAQLWKAHKAAVQSQIAHLGLKRRHSAAVETKVGRSIRILLLRHGEAHNNIVEDSFMRKLNSTSYDLEGTYRYKRRNNELIYSGLTERGEQQAIEAGRQLRTAYPDIKYVFISPMLRTVQTAALVMRGYPGEVQFFLLPWLKERIGLQADIGYNSYEAIKDYPFVDASIIKNKPFWFLDYWDEEHDKEGLGRQMRELVATKPSIDALLDFFILRNKTFVESLPQVANRKDKALQRVRDFVQSQESQGIAVEDYEILLVTHYSMLMAILVAAESNGKVLTSQDFKLIPNCAFIPVSLDL